MGAGMEKKKKRIVDCGTRTHAPCGTAALKLRNGHYPKPTQLSLLANCYGATAISIVRARYSPLAATTALSLQPSRYSPLSYSCSCSRDSEQLTQPPIARHHSRRRLLRQSAHANDLRAVGSHTVALSHLTPSHVLFVMRRQEQQGYSLEDGMVKHWQGDGCEESEVP